MVPTKCLPGDEQRSSFFGLDILGNCVTVQLHTARIMSLKISNASHLCRLNQFGNKNGDLSGSKSVFNHRIL